MVEEIKVDNKEKILVQKTKVNRRWKDSVFADLFSDKKYLLKLYQSLFPEDTTSTEEDLCDISLRNVLLQGSYNDLGFRVKDKMIILVEAQSTWSLNILIRMLFYLSYTYRKYLKHTEQIMYVSKKVNLPTPKMYVIYTGKYTDIPRYLSLKDDFFNDKNCLIDLKVEVLSEKNSTGINAEYILFCKILDDMIGRYGLNIRAVKETIRICERENILKEYLEQKGEEVSRMLEDLFDQETIDEEYRKALRREAREEGREEGRKEGGNIVIKRYLNACKKNNVSLEEQISILVRDFEFSEEEARDIVTELNKK